jgi:phosphomannomutase
VLALLAGSDRPLSELAAPLSPYAASGEINLTVREGGAALDRVERRYGDLPGVTLDRLDGLSVLGEDWWLNVRASNTEPLLRLNVEAPDEATMIGLRDSTLALLRSET